ncbi:MAG: translation initiation factor IF-6 [Methanobacteriota archaeon]|uniref:Translation initiation factor 6 n=1 Tax=Marine Group III euryarchaeote TaxID=2173149 RepID=A0A7J4GUH4_9ARCH|nr:MAG: translation initiation factor IF-6 [Euryarchaeota archaeon]HIF37629.1 translation initiation factor IF-6 [Marine Group III euryarchaeote]
MTLLQRDLFNSPYSGVFCATNDSLTFIPPGIPSDDMEAISEALGTRIEVVTIGGSSVLGTLIAMNSKGILVSNLITTMESDKIEAIASDIGLNFGVLSERSNAIGNNFLINDSGGFCNERLTPRSKTSAEEILEIKIESRSFNRMDTLGMIGCVTNKGGLCHPEISDEEKEIMEKVLEVPVMEGTVNFGMPLVGAGVISSTNGAVCGRQSTGIELGRVEEALRLF